MMDSICLLLLILILIHFMAFGLPGVFSRGSPVFVHLLIGSSNMSCNNLGRDVKLN